MINFKDFKLWNSNPEKNNKIVFTPFFIFNATIIYLAEWEFSKNGGIYFVIVKAYLFFS